MKIFLILLSVFSQGVMANSNLLRYVKQEEARRVKHDVSISSIESAEALHGQKGFCEIVWMDQEADSEGMWVVKLTCEESLLEFQRIKKKTYIFVVSLQPVPTLIKVYKL